MTDLAARPDADASSPDDETVVLNSDSEAVDDPAYEWAPTEPAPKKRHLWLWIGIPVAAVAAGLGAASLVLIAPGTSIAGVPVGGLTPGAAAEAVEQRLAATTLVLTSAGGDAQVTAAELGASVDADALVDAAFTARPGWNVGAWFGEPIDAPVSLDAAVAVPALRAALPDMYVDPTNASIAFDPATASYVVDARRSTARASTSRAVQAGLDRRVRLGRRPSPRSPRQRRPFAAEGTTAVADTTVAGLNGMLDSAGLLCRRPSAPCRSTGRRSLRG